MVQSPSMGVCVCVCVCVCVRACVFGFHGSSSSLSCVGLYLCCGIIFVHSFLCCAYISHEVGTVRICVSYTRCRIADISWGLQETLREQKAPYTPQLRLDKVISDLRSACRFVCSFTLWIDWEACRWFSCTLVSKIIMFLSLVVCVCVCVCVC